MEFIRKIDPDLFNIPMRGLPFLHRNLEWYATEDDKILGVVLLDLIDRDYSWVVLGNHTEKFGYVAIDVTASIPTQDAAEGQLFIAMLNEWNKLGKGEQK